MMRTRLVSTWRTLAAAVVALAACEQNGSLAQYSTQQNVTCPTAARLTVNDTLSLGELYSYLDEAKNCDVKPSISVDWGGTVEISQTITIPSGAELRIRGGGYGYYGDDVTSSSSNSIGIDINDDSTAAMASVIRGSGSVRLFFMSEGSTLFISGITLQNGRGEDDGGGGICALRETKVVSDNCFWESLSAVDNGGAIAATSMANLTMSGANIFSNCSSAVDGGAIYLYSTTLSAQGDARFENCTAGGKGGAMYTESSSQLRIAEGASISFSGCTAGSQQAGEKGGGMCSYDSSITVGENAKVSFENNYVSVDGDGGGLFGKNTPITISKGAKVSFVNNRAEDDGGGMYLQGMNSDDYTGEEDMIMCFTLAEGANAEFFRNAGAGYSGGVHFSIGCDVVIAGDAHFEQNVGERGGAMYMDTAKAAISGRATFVNNTAERWGGAVAVVDSESGLEFNGPMTFQNNSAGRSGGAVYLENANLNMTADKNVDTLWQGNSAGYDGGVIAVDSGVVSLQGGIASSNHASQRGGVLFSTGESLLSWTTGESWGNSAASGGSVYISNSEVNLTDVRLVEDHTPSGGIMFFADADARIVNTSIVAPEKLVGDFALHVDAYSVVRMFSCSFEMWSGDYNLIVSEGQLVMDACDFSQSFNTIILRASESATIRNALLGDNNYASGGNNASTMFGLHASTCSGLPEEYSCLSNEHEQDCVDAKYGMGVFCTEYIAAATGENISLVGGGSPIELVPTSVSTPSSSSAADAVYYPHLVTVALTLRYASGSGEANDSNSESWSPSEGEAVEEMATDAVLWELMSSNGSEYGGTPTDNGLFYDVVSADNFSWVAMPVSGILVKGREVTISLVGTPPPVKDPRRPSAVYNGEVSATFHVLSHTDETGSKMLSNDAKLNAIFYYCPARAYWDGEACVLCVELMSRIVNGDGSLECDKPGITLEMLPLAAGYWRGDVNRTNIQPCLLAEACEGGKGDLSLTNSISTENYNEDIRYCRTGYMGPYCAVCREGFRQVSGYKCFDCQSDWGTAAHAALWLAIALTPVLLVSLILFLFGGTTPFKQLRKKVSAACGRSQPAGVTQWHLEEGSQAEEAMQGRDGQEERASPRHPSRSRGLRARVLRAIPFQQLKILIGERLASLLQPALSRASEYAGKLSNYFPHQRLYSTLMAVAYFVRTSVVWQILTQFSNLAEVPYPSTYKRFLRTLDVFNFDLPWLMSVMCILGKINFYEKLFIVTLVPILMLGLLGLSYTGAMRWHGGTNRNAIESRQQAKVRHASTALLVLFLVFSSVSTTIFSTFACDYVEDLDVHLLRADYSISCDDKGHLFYQVYAGVMILVYPVGIPVMFAYLLLMRRDKINPLDATDTLRIPIKVKVRAFIRCGSRIKASVKVAVTDFSVSAAPPPPSSIYDDDAVRGRGESEVGGLGAQHGLLPSCGEGGSGDGATRGETKCITCENDTLDVVPSGDNDVHRLEVLKMRAQDFELQPTRFLWEPYEPRNFYFETVECGRRCLLTGALVFVLPNTSGQMAGASIFAFIAILVFELIRPHLCPTDAWMYRIGCIVIFFSNFLGLMAKTDVSGENGQSQEIFSVLLICVHVTMIVAIIVQSYLAMQAASESHDDLIQGLVTEENPIRRSDGFDCGVVRGRATPRIAFSPRRRVASRGGDTRTEKRVILPTSTHADQPGSGVRLEMDNARRVSR